jgi:hypothetical protein
MRGDTLSMFETVAVHDQEFQEASVKVMVELQLEVNVFVNVVVLIWVNHHELVRAEIGFEVVQVTVTFHAVGAVVE